MFFILIKKKKVECHFQSSWAGQKWSKMVNSEESGEKDVGASKVAH